jgi:hypothetical protein
VIVLNVLVNTEVWNRSTGKVAKTVLRTEKGTFIGATNQTKEIPTAKVVRPRVKFVVR